jgi:SAM-dependent methyltransferase
MCKSTELELFLDLGFTPLADNFLSPEKLDDPEEYFPLRVVLCNGCGLAQLDFVVPPQKMYNIDYPYESSTTKTGRDHFHGMAKDIISKFSIPKESLAVDLGSNVGVLLMGFKEEGMNVMGIEPSVNIMRKAIENGIPTIPAFFGKEAVRQILDEKGKAMVLTATNVFAHIHDLDTFMEATADLLEEKGVFVFEAPYFKNLLDEMEYDTIYHEHLSYLSIKPLVEFFKSKGWELFDVQEQSIHGGSLRCFVSRKGNYPVSPKIQDYVDNEAKENIHDITRLKEFAVQVEDHRKQLVEMLADLKKQGKSIVAVSAPAKGQTLLNYCKIGDHILDYVTEKAKIKIGKFTPGMHIPVFGDDKLLTDKPDYALLLAWNFSKEIIANNENFIKQGGKFIVPIPKPEIRGGSDANS